MKNWLSRWTKKADFLGNSLKLTYKGEDAVKTEFGGVLTMILAIFSIYSLFYFGQDIVLKEKPISRFSKIFNNNSRVYFDEIPLAIWFTDKWGAELYDMERYVSFEPLLYEYNEEGVTLRSICGEMQP